MFPLRDLNPTRTRAWITWILIAVCLAAFVYEAILPPADQIAFLSQWAFVPAQLTNGEPHAYVTILTAMFLHGGLLHVAGNLWFLHLFGDNVEDALGRVRYVILYFVAGIVATFAQYIASPDANVPMLGASGAIAGVLGAYAVLYPRARVLAVVPAFVLALVEVPALVFLLLWVGLEILASLVTRQGGGVAHYAHIGGFATGVLFGFIFRRGHRGTRQDRAVSRDEMEPRSSWGGDWSRG